jgi:hypothetical protein
MGTLKNRREMCKMNFRGRLLGSIVLLGVSALAPLPARAGLLGAGNTVVATYYNGSFANTESENAQTFGGNPNPVSLVSPVTFIQAPNDGSTILVGDTQITITNKLSGISFCLDGVSVGSACADPVDGFDFLFAGENILGVSVNPASSGVFQPATFASHFGLQLLSNNEIRVDVTGDLPLLDDSLILDLAFVAVPPPPGTATPEPASLALFGSAVGGIAAARRRRSKHA